MNVEQFLSLLEANPQQNLRIILPDGKVVAPHFHITEVGHVTKNFMDCGGTRRKTESCLLQTWVYSDVDHRLETNKLANILRIAGWNRRHDLLICRVKNFNRFILALWSHPFAIDVNLVVCMHFSGPFFCFQIG
jgi:hypothetical protein